MDYIGGDGLLNGKPKSAQTVGATIGRPQPYQSIFASLVQREVPPNGGGGIVTEPRNNPSVG